MGLTEASFCGFDAVVEVGAETLGCELEGMIGGD